jgi:pimeloyl-ACP methyl ester carboxylesterase
MLALAACGAADPPQDHVAIVLSPCQLAAAGGARLAEAECGTFSVPENRENPAGPTIELNVAVAHARRRDTARAPLIVLAGGPGQAATDFYAAYEPVFARIRQTHDIVLVDQRGTGGSNPLTCGAQAPDEVIDMATDPQVLRKRAAECLAQLPGDPRYYTTSLAVRDLDAVRAALGYAQVDLYGVSYGTRVAQHYLRRYPQHVRAIVLDGTVPPGLVLGSDTSPEAQRALDAILARCVDDARCASAFPDIRETFSRLRARLLRDPVEVTIPDPTTAQPIQVRFGMEQLGAAVRILSYSDDTAAMLPLLLHAAAVDDQIAPLAAQYVMVARRLGSQIAEGMHNAVICTEDVPYIDAATVDSAAIDASYLGALQLDGLRAICSAWPRGVMDPDLHASLDIDVPLLLLSGEADPITPPRYAEQVLAHAARATHLVLPGHGHGQLASLCVSRLVAQFLADDDPRSLDTRCVSQARPAPFFLDFTGTAP